MTKKPPAKPQPGDADLWRHLTAGVKPLPRAMPAPRHQPPAKSAARVTLPPLAAKAKPPPAPKPSKTPKPFAGLDKRNAERLRRGEWPIDGTLDLHNMTQSVAHAALRAYLAHAWAAGQRCILVITGKGGPRPAEDDGLFAEERGVLKRMLPRWLAEPALQPLILAASPAQPRHGGGGAFYVLLRRQRGS
jgi:DNA-nicking Smr family endonuclease